jgi:Topoisomerase II-associated protein PAT1
LPFHRFIIAMSFFGFDTSLPRDKPGQGSKGIFDHVDPFAELGKGRKLQAFQNTEEEEYVNGTEVRNPH